MHKVGIGSLVNLFYKKYLPHRILLDHVEKIDVRNDRGFTPLHIASRASLEDNVLLLLEYGADPNARGQYETTPLHRAIKAEIVQILLQHGADDCLTMKKEGQKPKTALDVLLDKNPPAAKTILDDKIDTNGQDLTSPHLLVVFDLEVIHKSEQSEDLHEMTLHDKLTQNDEQNLLEHPLSEAFLVLKSQLLRRYNITNIVMYFLYAGFLSALGRTSTKVRIECACLHNASSSEIVGMNINDCIEKIDQNEGWCDASHQGHEVMYNRFWILYVLTCALTAFVFFRERRRIGRARC